MIPYRLLLILSICLYSLPSPAQTFLGLKGGINRSHATLLFNIDPLTTTGRGDLLGFYFGVPLEIHLNEMIDLIPEVALVSEGSAISVLVQEEERTYNNVILYAKFPLAAKLKLLKDKPYEFGVVGGLLPAYAVDIKSYYFKLNEAFQSVEEVIDFEMAGIRRFDLGLMFGVNTEKKIAKGWKLMLDVRYYLGMLDVESLSQLTNTTEGFNLTIGLLTPIFQKKTRTPNL